MRIGFIGTGRIAEACVKGLAGQEHQILVTERNREISNRLASEFPEVSIASAQGVVDGSDTVCLALMEDVASDILNDVEFGESQSVISFMLGVTSEQLKVLCAPASDICITIPLPMIATGGCPLPVYPASAALEAMFGADNLILELANEAALTPHFGATAMLSTVLSQLDVAKRWLGEHTGSCQTAEAYLLSLMAGTFSSLPKDGADRIGEALGSLATEGGLNAQLRAHMQEAGAERALGEGLGALERRLGLSEG